MSATEEPGWGWWAGRDEEWMNVGPLPTREEAIAEGRSYNGDDVPIVVMEAVMHTLRLDAASILDQLYEDWADSDLFSVEHDAPEPQGSKEDQALAQTELQGLLDGWAAKWKHTLPTPNMFAATRNVETIPADAPEEA